MEEVMRTLARTTMVVAVEVVRIAQDLGIF